MTSDRLGRAGQCLRLSEFFIFDAMHNTSNYSITIPIGRMLPGEFLADLHESLTEAMLLIFERRGLDLDQDQTHALYVLTDFQQRIVAERRQK